MGRASLFLPPVLCMAAIYALSAVPGDVTGAEGSFGWLPPSVQNALHLPLYGGLAWLWRARLEQLGIARRWAVLVAFIISAGWGGFDEWHQTQVPGRYASLTDVVLNAIGALAGALFAARPPTAGKTA